MIFENKTIVVTGGTGALGRAVCKAFLDRGAVVHSSYIVEEELKSLPDDLDHHDQFHTHKVDLTDEAAVSAWMSGLGKVNVLANIAGGFAMGGINDISLKDWQHMQNMNLTTCFLTSREALKVMDPGHGRIINVASFAACQRTGGMAAYTTSKAAVISLTEAIAEETLTQNITVNAVLPTIMDTPGNRAGMPDADFATWVPVENVANTMVFLADENSWHITGACIPLRGHC